MSGVIDENVVSMRWENAQFQKGTQDSLNSLQKLKAGLNLDGAAKSLEGLDAAGKRFSLAGIASGVENISSKFTALGIVGVTALANIANQAVNAGLNLAKSLTVAPIADGFAEYELKMGSIQTILANTARHGTGLAEVTASLDELNTYADKTIYNFGDMTKNIGLFTNAGLGVQDATSMIKGFSNEAAASGTSAQGAAGAAYQLSQALSAGTIRLMDWRSLTNVGMGNKNMQSGLIEIAQAMGQFNENTTDAATAGADFNGSLEKQWLSSEVMSAYLKIMAGDMDAATQASLGLSDAQIAAFAAQQKTAEEAATKVRTFTQLMGTLKEGVGSSWAQTFDMLFGDFNEATELFTKISDTLGGMIGAAGDARNNLIQGWTDGGGRAALLEALSMAFQNLMAIMAPIREAFQQVFPPVTADTLLTLTNNFKAFIATMKPGEADIANLKAIFVGLFSIVKNVGFVFGLIFGVVGRVFGALSKLISPLLGIAAAFLKPNASISSFLESGGNLEQFMTKLGDILVKPIDMLGKFTNFLKEAATNISQFNIRALIDGTRNAETGLTPLETMGGKIKAAWEKVVEVFNKVKTFLKPMTDQIGNFFRDIGPGIQNAFKNFDVNSILLIFNGLLAGGIFVLFKNFFGKIKGLFGGGDGGGIIATIKGVFGQLKDTMSEMQNSLKAKALLAIAGAIALLTASVIALSLIDPGRLASALTGLGVMMAQLFSAMAIMEKITRGGVFKSLPLIAGSMILLGVAMNIFAAAVRQLSGLSWEELAKGMSGLAVMLGLLVATSKLIESQSKGMIASGVALVIMAAAIKILASAVTDLAGLSWEDLAQGLIGVGVLLRGLTLFTQFAEVNKGAVAQGAGLILLAVAIKLLVDAVGILGNMDIGKVTQGMISLGGVLAMMVLFTRTTPKPNIILASAASMILMGAAIKIIASALADFGAISIKDIVKGLVGMGGSLYIIAAAMEMMPKNMIVSALSLIAVGAALLLISDAFVKMGGMSWDEIGRGMVVLAGSLLIIAGAMYLMSAALPGAAALLVVAAALTLFAPVMVTLGSLSWEAIGKGLTVLAAGLGILAVMGVLLIPAAAAFLVLGAALMLIAGAIGIAAAGITAFATAFAALGAVAALGAAGLTAALTLFISQIPALMGAIGQGLVAFAGVIATSAPAFVAAIVAVISSILMAIATTAPQIVTTLVGVLLLLIQAIVDLVPPIIDAAVVLITALVEALVTLIPMLVDAGLQIIQGILAGIASNISGIVQSAADIVVNFIDGISASLPKIIDSGINLVISFINGLADGIRNNTAKMNEAGSNLASAIIDGMTSGLKNGIDTIVNAAKNVAKSALDAAKNFLGIHSPSREFFKLGVYSDEGLAGGMLKSTAVVVSAAKTVAGKALSSLKEAMARAGQTMSTDVDFTPTIRPVMDLTDLKKSASEANNLLQLPDLEMDDAYNAAVAAAYRKPGSIDDPDGTSGNGSAVSEGVRDVTFIQNNTSPKAIGAVETYRNTKNQISQAKDLLEV